MVIPSFGMIAPELVLIVIAIFMLMVSGFVSVRNALYINALFTVLSLILAFLVFGSMHSTKPVTFMDMVQINSFIVFVNQVILIASLIAYLLSIQWLRTLPHGSAEYSSLFLMATAGLMLVVSSSHFLSFYVAVEMASLCMYVMAAYERDDLHSTEAGIKYFVLGSLASAIMLFGISLIYGFAGTLSFDALPQAIHGHSSSLYVIIIGLVLVLVGLCFKLSLTPFHMWTPDVYNGAPTPVVAFFAMVPKIAIMSFLLNLTIHGVRRNRILLETGFTGRGRWFHDRRGIRRSGATALEAIDRLQLDRTYGICAARGDCGDFRRSTGGFVLPVHLHGDECRTVRLFDSAKERRKRSENRFRLGRALRHASENRPVTCVTDVFHGGNTSFYRILC